MRTISTPFAKRSIIVGLILFVITKIAALAILWNVYGEIDNLQSANSTTVNTMQFLARINMIVSYLGLAILTLGLILLATLHYKQKKK